MDALKQLLELKIKALESAKAEVRELSEQIQTLKGMTPTVHEKALAETEVLQTKPAMQQAAFPRAAMAQSDQAQHKNTKGTLTPVILDVLSDGIVRNMDEMLRDVNERMPNPTTRDSLRSTLGTLRSKKEIDSPGYGKYASQKGESPADVVATNDNGGALNVQLSPLAGHQ